MKRKYLNVVLDLDNTLISAHHQKYKRKPDFEITVCNEHYYVYKRPGLDKFLIDIFDNAKSVSIWTAATKDYCNQILKNILTHDERKKLKFIWSRGKTVNKNGGRYLKDMSKVFSEYRSMNPSNTILLDDNRDHMLVSPDTVVPVKAWLCNKKDSELSKISQKIKKFNSK